MYATELKLPGVRELKLDTLNVSDQRTAESDGF